MPNSDGTCGTELFSELSGGRIGNDKACQKCSGDFCDRCRLCCDGRSRQASSATGNPKAGRIEPAPLKRTPGSDNFIVSWWFKSGETSIAREVPLVADGLARLPVQAFDRVGGVEDLADLGRECEEKGITHWRAFRFYGMGGLACAAHPGAVTGGSPVFS